MLCTGNEFLVQSYKTYKSKIVNKHLDKIKNQLNQIKAYSLTEADKIALRKKLIELIEEQGIK